MQTEQIFNLLTKEYKLILATSSQDFLSVKKLRKNIISHHYPEFQNTKDYDKYLFSIDDKQSFIYLLRHNATGTYVGSVRVFFANKHTKSKQIPMQKDCIVKNIEHMTQELPVVEISRGSLVHDLPKHNHLSALQLRTLLTYGLMVATRINFLFYPSTKVFSIMEPTLHRILKRQKVNFEPIGDPIEHYGIRIPYAIEWKKVLIDTEEKMGEITRYYLKELCQDSESFWQFIDNNPYLERSDIQLDRICKLFEEYGDDVDLSLLLGLEKDTASTPTV